MSIPLDPDEVMRLYLAHVVQIKQEDDEPPSHSLDTTQLRHVKNLSRHFPEVFDPSVNPCVLEQWRHKLCQCDVSLLRQTHDTKTPMLSVWKSSVNRSVRGHPCKKPSALMCHLVDTWGQRHEHSYNRVVKVFWWCSRWVRQKSFVPCHSKQCGWSGCRILYVLVFVCFLIILCVDSQHMKTKLDFVLQHISAILSRRRFEQKCLSDHAWLFFRFLFFWGRGRGATIGFSYLFAKAQTGNGSG